MSHDGDRRAHDLLLIAASAAHERFAVTAPAAAVADAVERIVAEGEHTDLQIDDERQRLRFRTPQTIWVGEQEVGVTLVPMRRGCEVHVTVDVAPGPPPSAHDAEKNAVAVAQVRRQIELATA